MSVSLSQFFLETVRSEFAFLVEQHGFSGPYSDFSSYVDKVWFMGKNLAIEFTFEWRDQDISCLIVRLEDGKMPSGWAVNEKGERIRIYLAVWLQERGIHEPLFTQIKSQNIEEKIKKRIKDYTKILKKYGHDILQDRADVVFGL
jgi:hypothetical protein